MSCAYGGNVLSWYETGTAGAATFTEWSFTEVNVTQEEIDNARKEYANAGQVVEESLYYALSLLETGNESNAVDMLQRLKVESKRYATDAAFHLAVIDYEHNRLNEAHSGCGLL